MNDAQKALAQQLTSVLTEIDNLKQENAALRLASQAAAAHRKALEQLIRDCLAQFFKEPDEIVGIADSSFPLLEGDVDYLLLQDEWCRHRDALMYRFTELTTQELHGDS